MQANMPPYSQDLSIPPIMGPSVSLYVGDLDPQVTELHLSELFSQFSPKSIKVCRDNTTGKSLGYAYVNFTRQEDADKAMTHLNYKPLGKKSIRIAKSCRDPSTRKQGVGNLFVKNLPPQVTSQHLSDAFSKVGQILSLKVVTSDSGISKRYGFVHFASEVLATAAIDQFNGKPWPDPQFADPKGKLVEVMPFKPRVLRDTEPIKEQKFTNIFVKHLDVSVDRDKLSEYFGKYGEITSPLLMCDANGRSKCTGCVNFSKHEFAVKAVLDEDGKIVPGFSTPQGLYVRRHMDKFERLAELKKRYDNDSSALPPQSLNLYIKNLTNNVDDELLQKMFAPFGEIASAVVMRDERGFSKGFGFVCFKNANDAYRAIQEKNGAMYFNKPIYVATFQPKEQRKLQLQANYIRPYRDYSSYMMPPLYPPPYMMPGLSYPPMMPTRPYPPRYPPSSAYGRPNSYLPQQASMGRGRASAVGRRTSMPQQVSQVPRKEMPRFSPGIRTPQTPSPVAPQAMPQTESPNESKQVVGERLWQFVRDSNRVPADMVGKITGMLLESLGVGQVVQFLASPEALQTKIMEAHNVLQEHMKKQPTADNI